MTDPAPEPVSVRSRVRRWLALVSLALAGTGALAGTLVLGRVALFDATAIIQLATALGSVNEGADEFAVFISWIVLAFMAAGLVILTGILVWAIPIWLGGLRIFGGFVLDVKGQRTASAQTLLVCAACNGLGALLFGTWHHFAPATPYVLPVAIANLVGALVCVVVVGIAHARGTQAG